VLRVLLVFSLALSARADSIIRDVSVVDVVSGRIEPHRDIVIRGSRIAAVRPAALREKTVRYAIPGLWDMHVHLWFPHSQFPLYIANGVTGVRDMGSDLKRVRVWQAQIARETIEGPRIYACGSPLSKTASDDANLPVDVVENPAQARAAFLRDYEAHVDFVKVLDLSDKSFEALAEMSRHDGVPFAGHLPLSVPAALAAQDRMVSMEHLFGIGLACSARQSELRNRALTGEPVTDDVIGSYDEHAAAALWDLFRRYDVRQTPTLDLWARMSGEETGRSTPEVRYIEKSVREKWKAPEKLTTKAQYEFAFRLTRDMAKAGVPMLAGTDTGDPWTVPGVDLHRELALLVEAGLTPAQALRSATTEPARLMHREHELGEVRAGFDADLVVLTGDPLADIGNTRKIESVVVRGKVLDRAALDRMLARMAAEAERQ
jgi:imidazolonepropionase-like amidohydrolase